MRSICKSVVFVAASVLLVPQLATAADLEAEIADMKQRMEVMEDQLRVQNDELADAQATVDQQAEVIEKAGLEEREEVSVLSAFIESTDFNAWVAASYNFNFQGTSDVPAGGTAPPNFRYPHHGQSNTFQLDQAWIEIDKAPTEESRAGAHIDLQAGTATTTAQQAGGLAVGTVAPPVGIYSAYVSYLAPIAGGVQIDAGIMPTILGAEVEQTNANFNITRGATWTLQPVTSTGFLVSMELSDGLLVQAGMLNEPITGVAQDLNRAKALTSKVSYSAEKFGISAGVNWGRAGVGGGVPGSNVSTGIFDAILTVDPSDNLSAYMNYDYIWTDSNGTGSTGTHALSVAGRLGILDNTGVAARYEYISATTTVPVLPDVNTTAHTITGTVDHGLTDNLTAKAEIRYDHTTPGIIPDRTGGVRQGQTVALAQLLYEF